MANDLTKNPLKIDTAATITVGGSGVLTIKQMIWIGQANADDLVLTINGVDVAFVHTDAVDGEEKYILSNQPLGRVESFAVKTIDAGNLYVFLD